MLKVGDKFKWPAISSVNLKKYGITGLNEDDIVTVEEINLTCNKLRSFDPGYIKVKESQYIYPLEWFQVVEYIRDDSQGSKESSGKLMTNELWGQFQKNMAYAMTLSKQSGKYPKGNWMKPINPLELLESLERHFLEVKIALQENKPELLKDNTDGCDHLVKLANNCSMLHYQLVNHYKFPKNESTI